MNDFTKEELQLLKDCMNYAASNPYSPTSDTLMPLYNKLLSRLDNYCEHKELNSDCDHEFKLCRCFQGVDEYNYRCVKCLIIYEKINHDYKKVNVQ